MSDETSGELVAANRLADYDAAAERVLDAVVCDNTRAAFQQDWATWERFCANEAIPPTTVSPSVLVAFVVWLSHTPAYPGYAPATIERRLAGVLDGWRRRKLEIPHGITRDARRVIDAYRVDLAKQNLQVGRGPAPALTIKDLRRITKALPNTSAGVRDRAIIVLGFGAAARRSEVSNLDVNDIAQMPEGLTVHIRHGKAGARKVAVPMGSDETTCPVRCWRAWLVVSGITEGPAFRSINRWGRIGERLSAPSVGDVVTRAGELAGIELHLTGHSVRSGLATEARRAGHDAKTIAQQGGWKPNSAVLYGYMQIVDQWADNAVKGIGL